MSGVFKPRYAFIESISQSNPCVMTFEDEHDFVEGEILGFRMGPAYGMRELNNKTARVIATTTDTVDLDLDSTRFTPFVLEENQQIPAIAVPVGSGIIPGEYVPTVTLEDCFDNVPTN